ncbi:MAG TPA: succinylglutamate desuccinylase/aspartoacylase family protein [bacterium]
MDRYKIAAIIILVSSGIISLLAAPLFLRMRQVEPIFPGNGLSQARALSDYFAKLKNTRGDTEVYLFEGKNPGGTAFILGGTHPNEPAGFIAAVCLIENIAVTSGRVIIIPRGNNSGFATNDPQEANPQRFVIPTLIGERWFRYGSRGTNQVDQWPDPEVYLHYPSGQKLSGLETRNLNRAYPGRPNGSFTERVAYAIIEMMKQEHVDIGIDLHEASLEYPVINAIVAHPAAFDLAAESVMYLQMDGLNYNLEPSPEKFRGLSHREWGDQIDVAAILMESANPAQGRYHDRLTPDMVLTGKDRFYYQASKHKLLEVEYPEEGIPLKQRVGRHLIGLKILFQVWNEHSPDKPIEIENIPDYQEMQEKGIGAFLNEAHP